jgi:hypothetical protein
MINKKKEELDNKLMKGEEKKKAFEEAREQRLREDREKARFK